MADPELVYSTSSHEDSEQRRFESGDLLHDASVEFDEGFIEIMPYLSRDEEGQPRLVIPEPFPWRAAKKMKQLYNSAVNQLQEIQKTNLDNTTWTSYYRLLGQVSTVQIRHQAELGMMLFQETNTRRNMVDGLSGIHVGIAKHALEQYDFIAGYHTNTDPGDTETREWYEYQLGTLRGVISEHTLLALLNYEQSPDRYGVLPMLYQDLYRRTDILYYYVDTDEATGEEQAFKVPIQVKTGYASASSIPEHGIMLILRDYLPKRTVDLFGSDEEKAALLSQERDDPTYLARLLVKQYEPVAMTKQEETDFIRALALLKQDMQSNLAEQPGIALPLLKRMETDHRWMRKGLKSIAGSQQWVETMRVLGRIAA